MTTLSPQRNHPWLLVACASLSLFLVTLDFSVNVALPVITRSFQATLPTVQWIIIVYLATRVGLLLGLGGAADAFGMKRLLLLGAGCYTLGVSLIGLSPSLVSVVALRVLQGVGAAALVAVAPALTGRAFPPGQRGAGLGVTVGGLALGMVVGTLGGGLLVEALGWRAIFLARVPFGLALVGLALVALRDPGQRRHRLAFDWAGTVTIFVSLVSLVLGVSLGSQGWASPEVVAPLALAVLLLGLFLHLELRAPWPVLNLHAFRRRGFTTGFLNILLAYLSVFVLMFVFPFYVVDIRGATSLGLGMLFTVMATLTTLASPPSGWLSDRVGSAYVATAGMIVMALGLFWMGQLHQASDLATIGVRIAIVGLGLGLLQSSSYNLAMNALPTERSGMTAASLGLAQALGSVLGVTMSGAFFATRYAALSPFHVSQGLEPQVFVPAFQDTLLLCGAVTALGAALSLLAWGQRRANPRRQADGVDR